MGSVVEMVGTQTNRDKHISRMQLVAKQRKKKKLEDAPRGRGAEAGGAPAA